MCQSQAEGGRRCARHSHYGVLALAHAVANTDLDQAQVGSIFMRVRKDAADAPAPTAEEAVATLNRMRRDLVDDPSVGDADKNRLLKRFDAAVAEVEAGEVPDGKTWAGLTQTTIEAQVAQANIERLITSSARHQRISPERLGAKFRQWRRDPDRYEDLESPDPAFRPAVDAFPSDRATAKALRKMGFTNHLAQRLPVFVYGTLRRGQGNDRLMTDAIRERSEVAHVEGVAVYGAGRGFPYAQESPDGLGLTRGDLVYLRDDNDGDWARQRLDGLEGFSADHFNDSHYRRVERDVVYTDSNGETRTARAWVYLAGDYSKKSLRDADRITDGDWVKARDAYRAAGASRRPTYSAPDSDGTDSYSGDYVVTKKATDSAAVFAAAFSDLADD